MVSGVCVIYGKRMELSVMFGGDLDNDQTQGKTVLGECSVQTAYNGAQTICMNCNNHGQLSHPVKSPNITMKCFVSEIEGVQVVGQNYERLVANLVAYYTRYEYPIDDGLLHLTT